ncbi:MAG TPA: exonuclease domain-containing protein [Rhodocyclaceae bacterium]|nr:DNA polymerase III subunit epsilon [Rhodocyclaceae bacterium]HMV54067.1 exonuclease domain-containing protein [Rhodocyclaceae bacterium]HNA03033.1 exonuclease domain-containing protein [Rhodocyclaceae bacterium]HNB77837.1 exonuclease domain-containing protein [Rhodocyclaceae bacterium]HNC61511.1 exonuclease domain-containing protein [Rhodocyclaceae bacterium]
MGAKGKFALAYVGASAMLLAGIAIAWVAFWKDLGADEQVAIVPIVMPRAGLFAILIVGSIAFIGFVLRALYRAFVEPPLKLGEEATLLVTANPEHRIKFEGTSEFQPLVKAINALADQRQSLQQDVEQKIVEAKAAVEEEKNRLGALMSELTQSVVVCNLDGRILLYNNRARLQFKTLSDTPTAAGGGELIGLGRSIYAIFERNMISHALDSIQSRLRKQGSQPVANFVTTTRAGQLIRVQMAPVLTTVADNEERAVSGYVLMLDNITRNFENETRRDHMLQSLTEGSRASLAGIRAAVETLSDYPDMEPEQRDSFVGVIRDEVRAMSQRLDDTVTEFADALKARWPLEEMLGEDLISAAQRRIENKVGIATKVEEVTDGLWVKVDSFSLLQGLTYLAARLESEFDVREVRFRLLPAGRLAHLDIIWSGTVIGSETLMAWEMESMTVAGETSPLTLRDVMERHGGEIWSQREKAAHRIYFRLLIPSAQPAEQLDAQAFLRGESRPEYYDFDLFRWKDSSHALDDRLLTELTFTVFDTETTGLNPSGGDEIIQIGATRIVNGKLLKSEGFEQLVDPERELAPESAKIHGITQDMLEGQPNIDKVLPAFHAFCQDTVLVAHNAAFDMRFLQLKEDRTGLRFDHPVLDTLLLSAVIHPNQESHKLEAIAERLGVIIIGRHTAMGDAIVTGEVFLKMIPLLEEKGIRTLREVREAAEKTYYARVKY